MSKLGFIGLGNMGGPMVRNLLKAGHAVRAYDLVPKLAAAAREAGAELASGATDAARGAEIVVTMLPAGRQVKEVYLGQDGIVAAAGKGTLTFMVGGSARAFARAEPLLKAMGKAIVHAGPAGNGQAAKICNNMMLGAQIIAVAEGFALAEKLGLAAAKLFEISAKSSGQCWALTSYCPEPGLVPAAPSNRDFQPGFTAAMMLKDLRLAQEAAAAGNAATPLGAEAAALFTLFNNKGYGALDFSAIIRMIKGQV